MASLPPPPPARTPDDARTGHSGRAAGARDRPPWGPWAVLAAFAVGFGLWLVATAIIAVAARGAGSSVAHPAAAVNFALSLVFDLSFVAAALFFAVGQAHGRPVDFGYRRVSPGWAIAVFVVAGLSYYGITAAYASAFRITGQDKVPDLGLVGTPVFVCLVAPIAEEFFFRGFVFGALRRLPLQLGRRDLATPVAAVITGLLFGLAHGGSASPQYLIPLGLLGFILCLVRWSTGSLYPCMALHSVNNALAIGVDSLHWSGGDIAALMVGSLAVIGVLTGPLAGPRLARRTASA